MFQCSIPQNIEKEHAVIIVIPVLTANIAGSSFSFLKLLWTKACQHPATMLKDYANELFIIFPTLYQYHLPVR